MFKSLILVAVIAFSSHRVVALENSSSLPDNATLACKLGPDKAIYLFQQEKMVLLSPEGKHVLPLTLEFFEVYRCPGCFGFVGMVEGRRYEGHTEGVYREETGLWDVFMDLVIDGGEPKRLSCFWRH